MSAVWLKDRGSKSIYFAQGGYYKTQNIFNFQPSMFIFKNESTEVCLYVKSLQKLSKQESLLTFKN